ncbi:3-oxoacyl-[acyl-carrier protein] reductase [Mumia flava]|uniref:3-oxoacyl-[acyl-carrier protein] reductase n=1 Tax=Mumia flava TaxID=1348852 RepID=A0A0B2B8R5_9ACTN|nr:SDR family oxidoreductase [Mumia flava]PJJ53562.1 3-oxoacyl-[acyl-carrier protein] reductase [Mumia flava]
MTNGHDERVYLLTGATGGLGFATAEVLVAHGARVVISGRDAERVADAVSALGAEQAEGVVADNADPRTPHVLIAAARERFGRVDGLLVSVGGPAAGRITEIADEAWRESFESVFLGAVRITREVAAELGDGGSIALVLSNSVRAPIAGLGVSNGLRPGLAMVAKDLADELGPRGVRVNALLPARIDTERVRHLDALGGQPDEARAAAEAKIPMGRYGRPEEFGQAAAFLLSPAASYLTGVMLPVDGGATRAL